jgi:hypothetical protein
MPLIHTSAMMMTTLIVLAGIISIIIVNTEAFAQNQTILNQSGAGMIDLTVQGVSAFVPEGRDIYTITGEVFNNNTFPFNSQVVGVGSGYTSPSGIQPGLKAPFKIDIFGGEIRGGIDAIYNYTLQVAGDLQVQVFQ